MAQLQAAAAQGGDVGAAATAEAQAQVAALMARETELLATVQNLQAQLDSAAAASAEDEESSQLATALAQEVAALREEVVQRETVAEELQAQVRSIYSDDHHDRHVDLCLRRDV